MTLGGMLHRLRGDGRPCLGERYFMIDTSIRRKSSAEKFVWLEARLKSCRPELEGHNYSLFGLPLFFFSQGSRGRGAEEVIVGLPNPDRWVG